MRSSVAYFATSRATRIPFILVVDSILNVKPKKLPDLVFLKELFNYDPLTGKLTDSMNGEEVGWKDKRGYRHVRVKKKVYKVHRICFYMYHRRDPGKKVIDHIDGDKSNNQIFNLRACSNRDNLRNTQVQRNRGVVPKLEQGAHLALV